MDKALHVLYRRAAVCGQHLPGEGREQWDEWLAERARGTE